MKKTLSTLLLSFIVLSMFAQVKREPPIPVEILFGNNRMALQMSLNKPIVGNLRFNSINSVAADYKNTLTETELVSVNSFIYQFYKYVGVSGGVQWHFKKGLVPNVAVHFSYANPTWLLVLTPYLNFMPTRNSETVAIVEFKPALSDKLKLFTRVQGLYNQNLTDNIHDRSYAYFRLGLTINKYTIGAGANLDYYGPKKIEKQNFGGFFRVDL